MANLWFRLYSEFEDDPKVQSMPEVMQRRLIMLMCLKCKGVTFQERFVTFHWRITPEQLAETKALFVEYGFIDHDWNLVNWNKRQFLSDSSTERTRRYRERHETSQERHGDGDGTKRDALDTDTEQIQKQRQSKTKAPAVPVVIPDWVPVDSWNAFVLFRKKGKAPFTEDAVRLTLRDLKKLKDLGQDMGAVLEKSVQRGWSGVFPIKQENGNGQHSGLQSPSIERQKRNLGNLAEAMVDSGDYAAGHHDGKDGRLLPEPGAKQRDIPGIS